jgi:hypothetical protein
LHIIVYLLDAYGDEVAVSHDLTAMVCALLTDPQNSIRILVIDILGRLYAIFGEVLLVELGSNSKIKPTHIRAIKETAKTVRQDGGGGHGIKNT